MTTDTEDLSANAETPDDINRLIAEAEERGYKRGLNEQIRKQMEEPGVWEAIGRKPETPQAAFEILARQRPSIWND